VKEKTLSHVLPAADGRIIGVATARVKRRHMLAEFLCPDLEGYIMTLGT
jgi:hypothetical protein